MIYPDVPVLVHLFAAGIETGSLSAESEIIGVTYLTENDMKTVLWDTDYYNWEGYTALNTYMDGNFDHLASDPFPDDDADATPESDDD